MRKEKDKGYKKQNMTDDSVVDESNIDPRSCYGQIYYLLKRGDDPSINDNSALDIASLLGFDDLVVRLLQDSRVDPTHDYHATVSSAFSGNHYHTFRILLNDYRVDLNEIVLDGFAIANMFSSFQMDHIPTIKLTNHKTFIDSMFFRQIATLMFGTQSLELPALVSLCIFDQLDHLNQYYPMHLKWKIICLIKHFKQNTIIGGGFDVSTTSTGATALTAIDSDQLDLAVLVK